MTVRPYDGQFDHGMLFSPELATAIRVGKKNLTRRILKPQPNEGAIVCRGDASGWRLRLNAEDTMPRPLFCEKNGTPRRPKYVVGDRIWVRERWRAMSEYDDCKPSDIPETVGGYGLTPTKIFYPDDTEMLDVAGKNRSPLFMCKWMARTWARIVSVDIRRLSNISEEDAEREGVEPEPNEGTKDGVYWSTYTFLDGFFVKWQSLNAKRGFGVEKDPWVWRLGFEVEK